MLVFAALGLGELALALGLFEPFAFPNLCGAEPLGDGGDVATTIGAGSAAGGLAFMALAWFSK